MVRDGKLCLIYHAEDTESGYAGLRGSPGTMRLGLAESEDGLHFMRRPEPVLYPDQDLMHDAEWPGGCEIPRLVEGRDGTYYLYYSAWNKTVTLLAVATSRDLLHWEKRGFAFGQAAGGRRRELWSKAGAVLTTLENGRLVAARINGLYWMYWGESGLFTATSTYLIDWTQVTWPKGLGHHGRTHRRGSMWHAGKRPGIYTSCRRPGVVCLTAAWSREARPY